jgi:hypothetical protein
MHFDEAPKDSILSKLSLARRALTDKGLRYKILSDDKGTVDKLYRIDESYPLIEGGYVLYYEQNKEFADAIFSSYKINMPAS